MLLKNCGRFHKKIFNTGSAAKLEKIKQDGSQGQVSRT